MDIVSYFVNNYENANNIYYTRFYNLHFSDFPYSDYIIIEDKEAIKIWKSLLYPSNDITEEHDVLFGILSFYLYHNNYTVVGFQNILEKFSSRHEIANIVVYNATEKKYGRNGQFGGVAWRDRIKFIEEDLIVKRLDLSDVILERDIEEIVTFVSPRNAQFDEMTLDEKLGILRNVFEHIGKVNGKYIKIPFEDLSLGYIFQDAIIKYADELQSFRHGAKELVNKRYNYTDNQKRFLIDYGRIILNLAYRHINNDE